MNGVVVGVAWPKMAGHDPNDDVAPPIGRLAFASGPTAAHFKAILEFSPLTSVMGALGAPIQTAWAGPESEAWH